MEFSAESTTSQQHLFATLTGQIVLWWHPEHTWFDNPKATSIGPYAGGCLGERSEAGSAVHMTVGRIKPPEKRILLGGLGAMQALGLGGAMDRQIKEAGDMFTLLYFVHGVSGQDVNQWAMPVSSCSVHHFVGFCRRQKIDLCLST